MNILGDAAERSAVRTRLDETLFVEAGAGTGKTTVLVDRIVELVTGTDHPVPMRAVAAITFTEKAAAELRDRVRGELEKRARSADTTAEMRARCTQALDELDDAAICTLHSFAQRILTAFPVEAGLPPRIEVHDEVSSLLAFDDRWRRTRDDLLDAPDHEAAVLVTLAAGATLDHLRRVAEHLDDNWDLLDRVEPVPELPALDVDAWLATLDAVCAGGSLHGRRRQASRAPLRDPRLRRAAADRDRRRRTGRAAGRRQAVQGALGQKAATGPMSTWCVRASKSSASSAPRSSPA